MTKRFIPLGAGVQRNANGQIEFIAVPVLVVNSVEPTTTQFNKPQACPACGIEQECATNFTREKATPKPGDASLCIECGTLSVFQSDLSMALMTKEQFDMLEASSQRDILRMQEALRKVKGEIS